MPILPCNKDEVTALKAELVEAGVHDIEAAMVIGVADFGEGGWTQETVAGYAYKLKAKNPELWQKPTTAADTANAELEKLAFTGTGAAAATARAKLVRTVGEDQANIAAVKFGLTGIGDFKNTGKAPVTADDKRDDKDKDTASKNPWKLPPGPEGDAKRAAFLKSNIPNVTKVAAGLARAAGVDIAGRRLRA